MTGIPLPPDITVYTIYRVYSPVFIGVSELPLHRL
jgi:hypothetical protein